jgi:hypothetical protein
MVAHVLSPLDPRILSQSRKKDDRPGVLLPGAMGKKKMDGDDGGWKSRPPWA